MNEPIPPSLSEFLDQSLAAIPARRRAFMREELLAHLLAVYHEEFARLRDENAAVSATLQRFGAPQELNQDLRNSVPRLEHIWHYLFRKEHLMRWVFLILGVIGFFVGTGFICPALAQLLSDSSATGGMIGLSIALLLLGCAITLGSVWSAVHGVRQFRIRGS